ncbi:MAG: hypothetical protein PVH93_06405 [Nitrosopumilaceae archaeon]|jgi:hypothetical protein
MSDDEITCNICYAKIVVYFHEKYAGNRGKCPTCGVDFPLE